MKRGLAWALALVMAAAWLPACALSRESDAEEWAMVTAALASDEKEPVPEKWRIAVDGDDVSVQDAPDGDVMHVLLMGTDSPEYGRGKVALLLSVNASSGAAHLIALPEDALVSLSGLPSPVRLKYVSCFGGPLLTVKAVNEALQLNVTRYCAVEETSFITVIDRLGGVDLPLTDGEREAVGASGDHLDGEQALRYAKLRQTAQGAERPRKLLAALLEKAKHAGIDQTFSLIGTLLFSVDTNLTTLDLLNLLFALLENPDAPALDTCALPLSGDTLSHQEAAWCRQRIYGP